jgi:hypothetical protein
MFEKKQETFHSPDMSKLKAVVIDRKTRIYVPFDVDPDEARARYWSHREVKKADLVESK